MHKYSGWIEMECGGTESLGLKTVAALHQGAPSQMTWLEDPPPWLSPWLCPAYNVYRCLHKYNG